MDSGSRIQWVNLPATGLYKCDKITRRGHMGNVAILFKSKLDTPLVVKLKIEWDGKNAIYTDDEKKRHSSRFFNAYVGKDLATSKEGSASVRLPAAGGSIYKISAKTSADEEVKGTLKVISRRAIYCSVSKMTGVPTPAIADINKVLAKYHVELIGEKLSSPDLGYKRHTDGVGNTLVADFHALLAKSKVTRKGMRLVFVDSLADKTWVTGRQWQFSLTTSGALHRLFKDDERRFTMKLTLSAKQSSKPLWAGIDNDEFLRGMKCSFIDKSGSKLPISVHSVSVTIGTIPDGGHREFTINLELPAGYSSNLLRSNAFVVTFVADVATADSYNGYSAGDLVVVSTRYFDSVAPRPAQDVFGTFVHEVGHFMGLTANGGWDTLPISASLSRAKIKWKNFATKGPDIHACYYDDQLTHQGPHCMTGTNWDTAKRKFANAAPGCVMFGAGHSQRPAEFCPACSKQAIKLDLSPA